MDGSRNANTDTGADAHRAVAGGEREGAALVVERPDPGAIRIADVAGARVLKFAFPLDGVKIIALDVDLVLLFPDGAKLVLPGLALEIVSPTPPDMLFAEIRVDAQEVVGEIGDVQLSRSLPSLQLVSAKASKDEAEAEQDGEAAATEAQPVSVVALQKASAANDRAKFDDPAQPPQTANTNTSTSSSSGGPSAAASPSASVTPAEGDGNIAAAKLVIVALGMTDGEVVENDGGLELRGGAAADQAAEDPSFFAQSRSETLSGNAGDDLIFAEDPDVMPDGTTGRRLDVTIGMPKAGLVAVMAKVYGLPEGYSVANAQQVGSQFFVALDPDNDPNHATLDLIYPLPGNGAAPDDLGFYEKFTLGLELLVRTPEGFAVTNGSALVGVRRVDGPEDATFLDPSSGDPVVILYDKPAGNVIDAGAGNDTVHAGAGADTIIGGSGSDLLSYRRSQDAVDVDLGSGAASGGFARGDSISGFEALEGSAFADRLVGDAGANTLLGGAGADTLIGGAGFDVADYRSSTLAVTVDLAAGSGTGGDAAGDVLAGIEKVIGSRRDDRLQASETGSDLDGDVGDDTLVAGAGADRLDGGFAADPLEKDAADYGLSTRAVAVDLAAGTGSGGFAEGDTLVGIEIVQGSTFADTLLGAATDDVLAGRAGADRLEGRAGADTLEGGSGDDTLVGGAGGDLLAGGDGIDLVDYSGSDTGVTVRLKGTGAGGDAEGDRFENVEHVIGSAFGDVLAGDDGDNRLVGGAGDDVLGGLAGLDTLDGGEGTDTADYSASGAAVTADLQTGLVSGGDATGDLLISIENAVGGDGGDTLRGIEDAIGSAFADTLQGQSGQNRLYGGAGDGIIGGVANADSASPEAVQGLMKALEKPLVGMATGFSASLFGLAGSVLVGLATRFYSDAAHVVKEEFEEWLASVAQIEKTMGEAGAVMDQSGVGAVANAIVNVFRGTQTALDRSSDVIRGLGERQSKQTEALERTLEALERLAGRQAVTDERLNSIELVRNAVLGLRADMAELVRMQDSRMSESTGRIAELVETSANAIGDGLRDVMERQREIARATRSLEAQMATSLSRIGQSLDTGRKVQEDGFKDLAEGQARLEQVVAETVRKIDGEAVGRQVGSMVETRVSATMHDMVRSLDAAFDKLAVGLGVVAEAQDQVRGAMQARLGGDGELRAIGHSIETGMAQGFAEVARSIDSVFSGYADLLRRERERGEAAPAAVRPAEPVEPQAEARAPRTAAVGPELALIEERLRPIVAEAKR